MLYRDVLTQRAFSNEVITPGKTTVGDVRWWFLQQVNNLGLDVWFQPDLRIQRHNRELGKTQQFLSVTEESALANTNRLQDALFAHIKPGRGRQRSMSFVSFSVSL